MKQKIFFLFILFSTAILAQRKYAKEFNILNDNDLFISLKQDRYYTNGIFINYRYLSNKEYKKVVKKIYEIQIGHKMYTPFKATVNQYGNHDRPFAGYAFGSFSVHQFYKNETSLKTTLKVGMVGPAVKSKELQDFIHNLYGYKKAIGWKYQIANTMAINLDINYIKNITIHNYFDINWLNKIEIGTVNTNLSTGLYTRIGIYPLEKILNSIAFNSNLNNNNTKLKNKTEAFIYLNPMVSYIAYDATIKGNIFNNNSPVTFNVKPFKFTSTIGLRFTVNRFNFGYAVNYHTKKLKSLRVPIQNLYGTLQVGYQFN
ncbi:lipid A deacylase LpxR family protein [Tenacibaculum aestuariivivum]|uniref:lipid A deacylase LpxR family protein n=1 Tax=Tenacibaculum aestuariivivum TaxID=2006131 RepID=UPI003AB24EFC